MQIMESYRIRCRYRKTGDARFISGRNIQKIFERILRRADVPLRFTEGFSPHPRMSFGAPLPVNVTGTNEYFDFYATEKFDPDILSARMNSFSPEGIIFISVRFQLEEPGRPGGSDIFAVYQIRHESLDRSLLESFGRIEDAGPGHADILVRVNNFSHKAMLSLLCEGKITCINREILDMDTGEYERHIQDIDK